MLRYIRFSIRGVTKDNNDSINAAMIRRLETNIMTDDFSPLPYILHSIYDAELKVSTGFPYELPFELS